MIGTTIGRYRVTSKLGEGGMGAVWRAEDPVLGRTVALKVLPEDSAHSREARERLLREARTACKLHHPGIATVYEAGEDAGRIYLAFEHVEGETVADRVRREGPLPVAEALRIAHEVAEALDHAHGKGVLHRDVTSGNVMLDSTGRAKLVDFGLALPEGETRVTRPASTPGTIGYVAPEVVKGERSDRRVDLWGLGVVLYEMLTGRLPFERDRAEAVLYAVVNEDPESPRRHRADLPPEVEAVVLRALAKNPEQRFADAGGLLAALQGGADAGGVRPRSQRLRLVALVAVPVVAVVAFVIWWAGRDSSTRFDSVAVLPFSLPGENAEEIAYLATGLADALVTRLGRVSDLRITPWVTSRRYPPDVLPLPDIGGELNVESLVVGTFREEGGTLHVELSLLEAATGASTWSAEFEDTKSGLLELQEQIILAVARRVRGDLTAQEETALVRRPTDHAEAYDQYLRAVSALQTGTREGSEEALARFETALALDPHLAEAHVGVGAVHTERFWMGRGGTESTKIAEESFRRALEIDPEIASALRGLIHLYFYVGPNEECLRIAMRVRERTTTPGRISVEALLTQAEGYLWGGVEEEAVPLLRVIKQLDPANRAAQWLLVLALVDSDDPAKAIHAGEEYLRSFGDDGYVHFNMAGAYLCVGNHDAARRHYERSLEVFGNHAYPYVYHAIANAHRRMGDDERARSVAQEGIRQLASRLGGSGSARLESELARLYAFLGDHAKALELGRRSLEERLPSIVPLRLAAMFAEIGEDEIANEILLEQLALLRQGTTRDSSGVAKVGSAGPHLEGRCLCKCEIHGFDLPVLRNVFAFREFMEALHAEKERRRSLYGS